MAPRSYQSPEAFRTALDQRIRRAVVPGEMNRFRQLLIFDRFLARVFRHFADRVVLKGGLVLELRLDRARTTKDVDLRLVGDGRDLLPSLKALGQLDLGDWLSFIIEPDATMPDITGPGMVYDGFRFRAEARLAGKLYGDPFGVDVGFADVITIEPDVADGSSFFEFAGVEPATFRLYPRHAHIAEKLHAYTMPREHPNTRVKDLPDIALLASVGPIDAVSLRQAIEATFTFRGTHPVPPSLPAPVAGWVAIYERMARDDELSWKTLPDVHRAAATFLDPVLQGGRGSWDPEHWGWTE
jgi:hypothetical protein